MTCRQGVHTIFYRVKKKMCSRCRAMTKRECESQTWEERYRQMCICIDAVLEPNDQKYPTKLPEVRNQ